MGGDWEIIRLNLPISKSEELFLDSYLAGQPGPGDSHDLFIQPAGGHSGVE